jgi:hypothetical protein
VTLAPTTTTAPSCLDTTAGIDAVRCRVGLLGEEVGTASAADLGGKVSAKKLAALVNRAQILLADPVSARHLRGVLRQLTHFAALVERKAAQGKVPPGLANDLSTLAGTATADLRNLHAGSR